MLNSLKKRTLKFYNNVLLYIYTDKGIISVLIKIKPMAN